MKDVRRDNSFRKRIISTAYRIESACSLRVGYEVSMEATQRAWTGIPERTYNLIRERLMEEL